MAIPGRSGEWEGGRSLYYVRYDRRIVRGVCFLESSYYEVVAMDESAKEIRVNLRLMQTVLADLKLQFTGLIQKKMLYENV